MWFADVVDFVFVGADVVVAVVVVELCLNAAIDKQTGSDYSITVLLMLSVAVHVDYVVVACLYQTQTKLVECRGDAVHPTRAHLRYVSSLMVHV